MILMSGIILAGGAASGFFVGVFMQRIVVRYGMCVCVCKCVYVVCMYVSMYVCMGFLCWCIHAKDCSEVWYVCTYM
jgi:hypothetical protein